MLVQANKAFKAKASPPARNELSKQLFPSSSPGVQQNGNIVEHFKRPSPTGGAASVSARNTNANNTLKPKPTTVTQYVSNSSVPTAGFHTSRRSMQSLYNHSDSFREEPPQLVDLKRDAASVQSQTSVYFAEDDFSDGENLDMEYELPAALPIAPLPLPTVTQKPKPVAFEKLPSSPPPATQYVPWSSSPPSHFVPSKPLRASSGESLKRLSPDDHEPTELPLAKKRTLPQWKKDQEAAVATPASKPGSAMLWNTTASAVKDQRKQLRTKQKREDIEQEVRNITEANKPPVTTFLLSKEQRHILDLVVNKGKSVFFTGPAGTGKSVLMRAIIAELKKKWARDPERLAVTASTGLAACNVGGITLHSFAGIGLGREEAPDLVKKIRRNQKAKLRWQKTKTLIIDEISMVDGDLFDKLSVIGRTIRSNGRPWGGIQLVITGDFFQLPPVPDSPQKREAKFAFDAATWNTSIDHTIGLTEVFRQKDPTFANMLNEMRLGRITEDTVRAFKTLSRPLNFDDGLDMTELFPTRAEVERSNEGRLRSLPGKLRRYEAHDRGEPAIRDKLLQNMMAPKALELKTGAQVMLIKNIDETLVNGSLGRVLGFKTQAMFDLVYDGPNGDDLDHESHLNKKVKAFTQQLDESSGAMEFPVVQFMAGDGTTRTILAVPEDWKVELPNGEIQAQRSQLPLILAWALSIHKAQGQTLERVKVDLGKVFEMGQAYVALSRATSQEGLQVLRFEKKKVMAHPRVVQFYNKLYSAESAVAKAVAKAPSALSDFVLKGSTMADPTKAKAESQASRTDSFGSVRNAVDDINLDDEEEAMASYGY